MVALIIGLKLGRSGYLAFTKVYVILEQLCVFLMVYMLDIRPIIRALTLDIVFEKILLFFARYDSLSRLT